MKRDSVLAERIEDLLWSRETRRPARWFVRPGRILYAIGRDLTQGNLSLHAMSLVYTTLLSLVPLLAVSFSVLKGFGVHNQIEPLLRNALAPLGQSGREITEQLIGFVDNMQVGVLGSLGLAMLLYTVVSLIQKIEGAFNYAWRVTDVRPLGQRFTQYLSVLMIGPVLFFSAVGISASLGGNAFVQSVMHVAPMGTLIEIASVLAPYLMISLTFTFVYVFVPNTRVRIPSALIGALIAGLLWELIGEVFSTFMAGSTRYTAIYSSLAILVLFMIWIYLGWLILLIGASVAFYHQNPEFLSTREREIRLSNRLRERLALSIAARITRAYLNGEPPCNHELLAQRMHLPANTIQRMLGMLETAGYLVKTADADLPGYVLARAPESIGVMELLQTVRRFEETEHGFRGTPPEPGVEHIERIIQSTLSQQLKDLSVRDLAGGVDTVAVDEPAVKPTIPTDH